MTSFKVPVEMADLATSLNEMLERLEADFVRLQDFSGDLAHELRTPLNNLLTQTQVALSHPRDAASYRDTLASNAEEYQRLARMVSDMLFLAKADRGIALPNPENLELSEEVFALFDFYEAVAEDLGIELRVEGHGQVFGDRLMIRRAISNLLSNALRHAETNTRIEVVVAKGAGCCGALTHHMGKEDQSHAAAAANIRASRLKPLAVTSATRSPLLPEVPTLAEAGVPGIDLVTWIGFLTPAGVDKAIVAKLNQEIVRILQLREVRDQLSGMGMTVVAGTPEQFAQTIKDDTVKFSRIIKSAGIRID